MALIGMVKIHAHMMLRATPHFTALVPVVDPTPMMDAHMIWVVLTGIPNTGCPDNRPCARCFSSKTVYRAKAGDFIAHGFYNPPPAGKRAKGNCSITNQNDPEWVPGDGPGLPLHHSTRY